MSVETAAKVATKTGETAIELINVNKWYGEFHVLRDINLKVRTGERIVVCGPSGSGKSTMIRCINRLEEHQKGQIIVDNVELTNDLKKIDVVRREVGMVFQHFNLFPHLTILENLTLAPIWVRKLPRRQADEIAMRYLEKVRIPEQAHKYPGQLSGGQQQRVALARALITEPKVLLLDEPTEGIQPNIIQQIGRVIKGLRDRGDMAIVLVEQYLDFASELGDRFEVMDRGAVVYSTWRDAMDEAALKKALAI